MMTFRYATILFLLATFTITSAVYATDEDRVSKRVTDWLQLDAVSQPLPVFNDVENIKGKTFGFSEALQFEPLEPGSWWPKSGDQITWNEQRNLRWSSTSTSEKTISFTPASEDHPSTAWAGFYLNVDRYQEIVFHAYSHHPLRIYVNGEGKGMKTTSEPESDEAGRHAETLQLETGTYFIMVKTMHNPEHDADWKLEGVVEFMNAENRDRTELSTQPDRHVSLDHLSNQAQVSGVSVSSDGELAAVSITRQHPPEGRRESWIEIRNTSNGEIVKDYRGDINPGSIQWAPNKQAFSYTENISGNTTLWLKNLESGSQQRILDGVSHFGGYRWSPDGKFIVYSVSERGEPNRDGVRQIKELPDRRPGYNTRSFLYRVNVDGGAKQRLTAGIHTTSIHSIHPDGNKILFSRSFNDYETRPYSVTEYNFLDLNTLEVDSLFTLAFGGSGQFSQNGNYILFTGGPSMFGDIGINVPEGTVPNDYDTQAYIYRISDGEITAITKDFDPAVNSASWDSRGNIYLTATEKAYNTFYQYEVNRDRFTKIETDIEVISNFSVAQNARVAAYFGTGLNQISRASAVELRRNRITPLVTPSESDFRHVQFGEHKPWTFTAESGSEIDGHVYYPVNFDPDKSYPVIVYYYGGTVPVTRAFGGRYPKEFYAANGYMVYVLQPSGATGFGQEFSALHVNDWGIIVADEIIQGTTEFLEAHPYANPEKVGAIGASYGGFMTKLLLTQTDIFAGAVSHAGIANITSYWGEGFWGYGYSAIATAYSFPWNRPDIYIDQSSLFNADKINTPLLLTTGMSDTNVPPGESIQMFTALKLLGKDVAFIAIDDQDHHIVDYEKYRIWKRSILAWYDKYLKGEPEWWESMYD